MVKVCTVEGCDRSHLAKGYCSTHYQRVWARGTIDLSPKIVSAERQKTCLACGVEFLCSKKCGKVQRERQEYCSRKCARRALVKHGLSKSRAYRIWAGVKQRCTNPSNPSYAWYGGKNITMTPEWVESFEAFYRDMGDPPHNATLDRVNNDKGYSVENCRWATIAQQARNRSDSVLVRLGNATMTLTDWAQVFEISFGTVQQRISSGWTHKEALITPVGADRLFIKEVNKDEGLDVRPRVVQEAR